MRPLLLILTVTALVIAGCGGGAPAATSTPAARVTAEPTEVPEPTADPATEGLGIITFGKTYDPETLEIPRPTSKFKRTLKEIAWSARFSETAGTTTLTIVLARVGKSGAEELLVSQDVQISSPDFDTLANSADLAALADNKAGTYVLRYLRESTILAEGTFRLVK